jgi:hypothetical protein
MTPEIMSQAETLALPSEALPILTNGESTQTNIPNGLKNSITTKNTSQLNIKDTPVENFRRMRVVVIGAGFSGIYLGVRIPQRLRNVELAIYEKNDDVGGTWYENRYPGCACDIPCKFARCYAKEYLRRERGD